MTRGLTQIALGGAKLFGGFWLADRARGPGIAILCYHGFSMLDEHNFRPKLFIRAAEFERRLTWLRDNGYTIITLEEAVERLETRKIGKRDAVITLDDGFVSVGSVGWPLLKKYGMPATLYATTYYATHGNPIFRLAIQYFFWRTTLRNVKFSDLCSGAPDTGDKAMWQLIEWGERRLAEDERWALARQIAERLHVDHEELRASRRLSLLSPAELRVLAREGLDVQLHTHRHNLPDDPAGIEREISDNRSALTSVSDRQPVHFCYPSGVWSMGHWSTLAALGVRTATTCDPGFNHPATPRLALRRFLDSEDTTQRVFEAELTGFKTLLRALRF